MLSGAEVCAILKRHGYSEVRRRGSHILMQKRLPETTRFRTTPNCASAPCSRSFAKRA
ncbi:type II toxin-antitoxin system HicA family toxin [Metallibacterium sp.]